MIRNNPTGAGGAVGHARTAPRPEVASRTTAAFRDAHPELPWTQMIGMRDGIVHRYDDVDPDLVWRVATEDVEPVLAGLERLVGHEAGTCCRTAVPPSVRSE